MCQCTGAFPLFMIDPLCTARPIYAAVTLYNLVHNLRHPSVNPETLGPAGKQKLASSRSQSCVEAKPCWCRVPRNKMPTTDNASKYKIRRVQSNNLIPSAFVLGR